MPFTITHPPDRAERVEGEPFYRLAMYTLLASAADIAPATSNLTFQLRAFDVLPPCDAVGLLSGVDSTGLIVWGGALAFIEWLAQSPQRLEVRLRAAGRAEAHVIELGCGSGIVSVALCALLRGFGLADPAKRATPPAVRLWATDGNPECVSLTRRNLREQCNAAQMPHVRLAASAALLRWGDPPVIQDALQRHLHDSAAASSITIVSADVLYDSAAVPLLVSTVSEITSVYSTSASPSMPPPNVEWWLAYTPRGLTRAGNVAIFQSLLDAIAERWPYDLFDLPAGAVSTGFEHSPDGAVPALLGCILVMQVTSKAGRRAGPHRSG
ncbi:hypothetical protein LSCM1_07912 [Leishmania martiniquensis]|uniref:Methyltransferase n=1 Tax=Leishmania martiniquensis TaxID=1580590 RepID=A0A836KRT6_9TRYP|nr:hypothetical protein LSCM1_07912 [Leishmania martiniquensis]